jgi:hypothetical protein
MVVNPQKQQGFVLAATLWALAIMFVVVGVFNAYVQRKMVLGLQAKAHLEQTLDQISTEQTLLYLLNTTRMTRAGITFTAQNLSATTEEGFMPSDPVGDEIWVDDTAYQGIGDTYFSIQDATGVVDLNSPDPTNLGLMLNYLEPNPVIRTRLLSGLADYIDSDDLIGIGGAEKQDYLAKGMAPPTNDYLRSPAELQNVYTWNEWLKQHPEVDYRRLFGFSRSSVMNINAMSKDLLVSVIGLSPTDADQYIIERRTNPVAFIAEIAARYRIPPQVDFEERYRTFPSRLLRLSFWNKGGGQARMISLQLTPNGLLGPWQVDYEYSVQSVNNNNEPLAIRQSSLFKPALGDDTRAH